MKRIWCGLVKMTEVFGMHFVAAIVAVAAMLIWAVMHVHGPLAAVAGLICVLLAVRAHDFGAEEDEPNEVNAAYDPLAGQQWTPAERADLWKQRTAMPYYTRNTITAMGKNHEGQEL